MKGNNLNLNDSRKRIFKMWSYQVNHGIKLKFQAT